MNAPFSLKYKYHCSIIIFTVLRFINYEIIENIAKIRVKYYVNNWRNGLCYDVTNLNFAYLLSADWPTACRTKR